MLDRELKYLEDHRADLLSKYRDKVIVIADDQFVGAFDNETDAMTEAVRQKGLRNFLIRRLDEVPQPVSIPALTLGILSANTSPAVGSTKK